VRPCHHECMSQPDDIDKLLREIDSMNAGSGQGAALPAPAPHKAIEPATGTGSDGGGRAAWTGASAVGGLLVGSVAGLFLPGLGLIQGGVAAALGAVVTGFVSGPPDWFRRG
jgi:hypothetical protein